MPILSLLLPFALSPSLTLSEPIVPSTVDTAPAPRQFTLDEVAELLAIGKRALVNGDATAALESFTAAHKAGPTLRTEIWLLRAKLITGELDEAFDRIIVLETENSACADLSYVIGAARHAIAKREESRRGGNPGAGFEEAVAYLLEATEEAPDEYPDAWLMLAESARWMGQIEVASKAIDRALEAARTGPTLALASKIRVARGAALLGDDATKDAGKRMIEQGASDAAAAAEAFGSDKTKAAWIADAHLQHGLALLFLERKEDAGAAYAAAMSWDPTQVDYGQLMGSLTDADGTLAPFVDVLEEGAVDFEKRWGQRVNSDAGLHWWRGYAQHRLGRHDDAIESMEKAVAKFPAYANAYWYIGVSHYNKGEKSYPAAVAAWQKYSLVDRDGFAQMVKSSATNKLYLQRAQFVLYGGGRGNPGLETAAEIAELLLDVDDEDPTHWNDAGLMHRDAGAYVASGRVKEPKMSAKAHFERSWEAYSKAIAMQRKSYYLNDGAVILHYYLERDYDLAIEMYDEAEKLARAALEKGGLSEDEKPLVEIALRDSVNNRDLLKKKIEREKKKKESGGGDGGGDGGQ